ncbi:hypothetical protein [Cohnella sp. WQ 127256]|uniref:hypothetical protein n=1 Tax=Cohnella sp. WQ 127256 TaxID=2938790 RepID=UPI002118F804|nr:hypothetical protein [Cohnella sp. WQ 127256]
MRKIFIVGIVASGKTTLAKRLSKQLNIPLYELDCIVHAETKDGRRKRSPEEQAEVINEINSRGQWIFEGTDRESYRCVFEMADTIIFLDPPLWKRKLRIFTRYLKQNIGIEKSHYKADIKMLKMMYRWTRDFELNRDDFESRLDQFKNKLIRMSDNPINLIEGI